MITYIETQDPSDIFKDTATMLICPTNTDGTLDSAFALFFPIIAAQYQLLSRTYKVRTGGDCRLFEMDGKPGRLVLCAATREGDEGPKELYIETILKQIVARYQAYNIDSIAMWALGCGQDQLVWHEIGPMIAQHLECLPINVRIYVPEGTYPYHHIPDNKEAEKAASGKGQEEYRIYTVGYQLKGAREALEQLVREHHQAKRPIMLLDIRQTPESPKGNPNWYRSAFQEDSLFGPVYRHLAAAGNTAHRIEGAKHKLADPDTTMREIHALVKAGYSVVLICACKHDHCHRFTVLKMFKEYLIGECWDETPVIEKHLLFNQ